MMRWIVGFFLILGLIGGGLGRLVLAFRPDMKTSEASLGKTNLIILGLVNFIFYSVGIIFLLKRTFEPLPILLCASIPPSLLFVLLQLKSRNWFRSKSSNN
jgi:hypothetical protein